MTSGITTPVAVTIPALVPAVEQEPNSAVDQAQDIEWYHFWYVVKNSDSNIVKVHESAKQQANYLTKGLVLEIFKWI
jgi:hypothetical protein